MANIVRVIFFLVAFALPLMVPSWHGKLLMLLVVFWVFSEKRPDLLKNLKSDLFQLCLLALLALYGIGLLYSENMKYGLSMVESFVPIILMAAVVGSVTHLTNDVIKKIFLFFVAGVICLNLASLAFLSFDLWDPKHLQSYIILANNNIVQIHPAYSSLYLSFAVFFLIDQYFPLQTTNRKKLGWILFSLVILISYLIWINSRTGILSFFVAALVFITIKFDGRKRVLYFAGLLLIVILIGVFPFSRERFINSPLRALTQSDEYKSFDASSSTLVSRRQILDCSIDILKWPEILIGYGTGDFKDELRKCYKAKSYEVLEARDMDSNNEYFAQIHRHGILGLILFLAMLLIPLSSAFQHKVPLLAAFIILFAVTAMFENVLSAQKGATFFALICPLLMLRARQTITKADNLK